ncbi:MAG: hypothetical protein ACK4YQ_07160 [Phenylobacterium sp.]|uniref:hypothetical protein n=1 Tax=Phenylobacterium sp. TaxID=1871053 RepID=UPI00391B318F
MRSTVTSLGLLAAAIAASPSSAKTLAICGAVSGHAYFVAKDLVSPEESGWDEDRISIGRITLSRADNGDLDVAYVDATGDVFSSRSEGAAIVAGRMTTDEAAVLVAYPGQTMEIYQFVRNDAGEAQVLLLQSKGSPIAKASVLVGSCSLLDLQ